MSGMRGRVAKVPFEETPHRDVGPIRVPKNVGTAVSLHRAAVGLHSVVGRQRSFVFVTVVGIVSVNGFYKP